MPGRYSVSTVDPTTTASSGAHGGSASSSAQARPSTRAPATAPTSASTSHRQADPPHDPRRAVLGVGAAAVDRQPLGQLQAGDDARAGVGGALPHGLPQRPRGQHHADRRHQRGQQARQQPAQPHGHPHAPAAQHQHQRRDGGQQHHRGAEGTSEPLIEATYGRLSAAAARHRHERRHQQPDHQRAGGRPLDASRCGATP